MSDDVSDLLERFASQVRSEEYSSANETATRIAERYEEKSANETVLREQATAVADPDGNNRSDTLREFLTEGFRVEMIRSTFLMSAGGLQVNPTEVDADTVADHAMQAKDAEDSFSNQLRSASSVLAGTTVPGQHAILSAGVDRDLIPKGESTKAKITIGNVGDEPVRDVRVTLSSSEQLAGEATIDLGNLNASSETDVENKFEAVENGEGVIKVSAVDGEGDTETAEIEVTVVDKREALELARDRIADLLELVSQQNSSENSRATDIRKRTRNIRHVLDRAMNALDAGNERQADAQLKTAQKQATTLLDDLSRDSDGQDESNGKDGNKKNKQDSSESLEDTVREQAILQLESVIELVSLARSAEI